MLDTISVRTALSKKEDFEIQPPPPTGSDFVQGKQAAQTGGKDSKVKFGSKVKPLQGKSHAGVKGALTVGQIGGVTRSGEGSNASRGLVVSKAKPLAKLMRARVTIQPQPAGVKVVLSKNKLSGHLSKEILIKNIGLGDARNCRLTVRCVDQSRATCGGSKHHLSIKIGKLRPREVRNIDVGQIGFKFKGPGNYKISLQLSADGGNQTQCPSGTVAWSKSVVVPRLLTTPTPKAVVKKISKKEVQGSAISTPTTIVQPPSPPKPATKKPKVMIQPR